MFLKSAHCSLNRFNRVRSLFGSYSYRRYSYVSGSAVVGRRSLRLILAEDNRFLDTKPLDTVA